MGLPGAKRCCCPTKSSMVEGITLFERGILSTAKRSISIPCN
jgi:hypothetical protein